MKEVFIINPYAGNGKSLKVLSGLKKKDNRKILVPGSTMETTRISMVESHKEEPMIIYAVGGDGTLNNVANGIIGSKAILGVIPVGSGNDFYKTLKESKIEDTATIDVGIMNQEYFLNIASVGFDANVIETLEKNRHFAKFLPYPRAIIREFLKEQNFQIIEKGYSLEKITLLAVCNGRYYGNGIKIAPNAIINDGLLDAYQLNEVTRLKLLKLLLKVLKGQHEAEPEILKEMITNLDFTAIIPNAISANLDGEARSYHKFNFGILKNGLTVTRNIPDDVKRLGLKIEGR